MSEEKTTPEQQAKQTLAKAKQERLEACQEEIAPLLEQINEITKRHGCLFAAHAGLAPDGRVVANMAVVNVT